MRRKFKVGDSVLCTMGYDGNSSIRNQKGTVRVFSIGRRTDDHALYGVEFRNSVDGHQLDGACASPRVKSKHGWWVPTTHLKRCNREK